jgi:hypothetical protein
VAQFYIPVGEVVKLAPKSEGIDAPRKKKPKEIAVITECCTVASQTTSGTPVPRQALSLSAVMLSPFAVILSEAKDLCSSLRVNSAKHPCSLSLDAERKRQLRRSFAPTSRGSG